jgi:hypothetical protein
MKIALSLILAAALAIPAPALAGNKGKKAQEVPAGQVDAGQLAVALITAAERALILGYFADNRASLPVALATAKPLPPGIAKKIARGGSLPPGIAKRYLPGALLVRLPARPDCNWVVVGTDVLLIAVATGVIVDILVDVL